MGSRHLYRGNSPQHQHQIQYCDWDEAGQMSGLRNNNNNNTNSSHANVGSRSPSRNVNPRQNYHHHHNEFDYEDMIESAASSVSNSSGYGRRSKAGSSQQQQQQQQHNQQYHQQQQQQPRYSPSSSQQQDFYLNSHYKRPVVKMNSGPEDRHIPEKFRDEKDGSEIYVMDHHQPHSQSQGPPGSVYSHFSGRSRVPSEAPSSVKTKTSRKGGVVIETMSAPNPFCPNSKGVCCLLVLINLGLILICLGFSIVLQLYDPPYLWYFGVMFLIVGFLALLSSMLFCVHLCRENEAQRKSQGLQPGELYWTHHWQKKIALPSLTRDEKVTVDDTSTVYSPTRGGTAEPIMSSRSPGPSDDRYYLRNEQSREMTPIHSYSHNQNRHH